MNLVPIKVKIGLRANGHADHPDFNRLASVVSSGLDWSKYVDKEGLGWHYDKISGHKEETVNSPRGQQFGVLIVPKVFADEAIAEFPTLCTKLDETQLTDFYDNRAHAHEPDELINEGALKVYESIESAGGVLTGAQIAKRAKALDPNDAEPGIKKNTRKKWADYKQTVGVTIVQ